MSLSDNRGTFGDRLAPQFVQSILRQFPDFTYAQAFRLADRLHREDMAWFAEQVMADIAALPTSVGRP